MHSFVSVKHRLLVHSVLQAALRDSGKESADVAGTGEPRPSILRVEIILQFEVLPRFESSPDLKFFPD